MPNAATNTVERFAVSPRFTQRIRFEGFTAEFLAQEWEEDYAYEVAPEGPTVWHVTPEFLQELITEYASKLRPKWIGFEEDLFSKAFDDFLEARNYHTDALRCDPAAPAWIKGHDGPFECKLIVPQ